MLFEESFEIGGWGKTHHSHCECLQARIEGQQTRRSDEGEVCIMYKVGVRKGKKKWSVFHRYTHFLELHNTLLKSLPASVAQQLRLPGRRYLRKYFELNTDDHKRERLNQYLQKLLHSPHTKDHHAVLQFLQGPSSPPANHQKQRSLLLEKVRPQDPTSVSTALQLYREYKHVNRQPPESPDGQDYAGKLAAAVASVANPRIRRLRVEHEQASLANLLAPSLLEAHLGQQAQQMQKLNQFIDSPHPLGATTPPPEVFPDSFRMDENHAPDLIADVSHPYSSFLGPQQPVPF